MSAAVVIRDLPACATMGAFPTRSSEQVTLWLSAMAITLYVYHTHYDYHIILVRSSVQLELLVQLDTATH